MRALLFLAVAVVLGAASIARAIEQAEPTPQQKARCDKAATDQGKRFCLAGYGVRGLQFPQTAIEGGPGTSVPSMAIYKPAGPGPFPALVLLHTCAGLSTNDQMPGWVHTALAKGYVAFVLDSFSQRGFGSDSVCNGGWPGIASIAVRARDAFDALDHLARLPFVDKTRIAAMGFSHGARVAYLLTSERVVKAFASAGRFAAVVAVYGQCFSPTHNLDYVHDDISIQLLALLGAEDHDGDPKECIPRLDKVKAGGAPVQSHVFGGVGHVWDQPSRSPGKRMPLNEPPGWTWFGYDANVTEQSHALAFDFFARAMR